jgi:hypothetical protein
MRLRPLPVLALVVLFAAGLSWSSLRYILAPAHPPLMTPERAYGPPLTRRLLFVLVDGLRYDVATDGVRMPIFAKAMRTHTSAEVWCGQISMTGSAIHAYGTGQSGGIEQVLANVRPRPPPFESWLSRAHAEGLTLALSGEPEWIALYGSYISHRHLDPIGVPIGFDFNDQTFAGVWNVKKHDPNFLLAHFVTPDHQGHRWGIPSPEYARHIHDFDQRLSAMLAQFGPEWTVIVTSDHGATDTGTHGTDVPVQRRSPIYAYGPGIAPGVHAPARLEQVDVGSLMAVLLGLPPPRHGRGRAVVEWLDIPPAQRQKIACADAERGLSYGEAALGQEKLAAARAALGECEGPNAIAGARDSIRKLDSTIASNTGIASPAAWVIVLLAALFAACIAGVVFGAAALQSLPIAALSIAVAVLLVRGVERLPGVWPNAVRIVLFTIASLGVLWSLTRPKQLVALLDRAPRLTALLVPGALVVTYPTNTQPMAYLAIMACACVLIARNASLDPLVTGKRAMFRVGAVFVPAIFLWWPGTRPSEMYPGWLMGNATAPVAAAIAIAIAALALIVRSAPSERTAGVVALVAGLGSIALLPHASPLVGRSLLLVLAAAAIWAAWSGRRMLALGLGMATYVWLCRFWEIPVLVLTVALAETLARSLGKLASPGRPHPSVVLLLATFIFGLLFVQRVGIQGGIDLAGLDQTTAVFGDPATPYWVAGTALIGKYALATLLVLGAALSRLEGEARESLLSALVVVYAVRTLTLLVMLVVCGGSFWTAQRVIGDLPFALLGTVTIAITWCVLHFRSARRGQAEGEPGLANADPTVV